jgi:hypothetical protein
VEIFGIAFLLFGPTRRESRPRDSRREQETLDRRCPGLATPAPVTCHCRPAPIATAPAPRISSSPPQPSPVEPAASALHRPPPPCAVPSSSRLIPSCNCGNDWTAPPHLPPSLPPIVPALSSAWSSAEAPPHTLPPSH